jgi:hypothetical protein
MSKTVQSQEDGQGQGLEIPLAVIDEQQIKQFQSLYYLFKGKRDTDIKLFDNYKQFSFEDIVELNNKVYKKLQLHDKITDLVNVTVGLDNREIRTFGTWYEFYNTDWKIAPKTKYISIEWDFNVILPNQMHRVPQTHTLRVRMGNNIKPSDMIQMVFQDGDEYELEEIQSQMVCKIDFVNAQICSELKSVVCDWYEALPKNSEEHKMIKFILKNLVKIQNVIELSFISAGIILTNFIYNFLSVKNLGFIPNDSYQKLFLFLTAFVPVIYLFYRSGVLYADRVMRKTISKFTRNPMFEITKGDANKLMEVNKINKSLLKKLAWNITYALGTNLVMFIIGLILEVIKKK